MSRSTSTSSQGRSRAGSSSTSATLREAQIEGRQDEQVEQGRGDEAAEDHDRHRVLDLVAGMAPAAASGTSARPVARRSSGWCEPLLGSAQHEAGAERLALLALEVLEVADHQDPLRRRCRTRSGTRRASRATARRRRATPRALRRPAPSAAAGRSGARAAGCRTRPGAAGRSRSRRRSPKTNRRSCAAFSSVDSPSTSAWYSRGNSHVVDAILDLVDHGGEVTPLHVGADVDAPRLQLALDLVRGRRDPHVGDLLSRTLPAAGVSIGSRATSVRLSRADGMLQT